MIYRCLLLLCLFVSPAGAMELDEILTRNSEAVGGSDNWSQINNVRFLLDIREPGFQVSGTYIATRGGDMRIDIRAKGQRVFSEGLHQGQAWEWRPQTGRTEVGGKSAAALRHGIDLPGKFYTLQQVRSRGASIDLIPSPEAKKRGQWQLEVTLKDGFSSDYFIDRKTYRIERVRDHRAFHPAIESTQIKIETSYDVDLWIDGVLRHARSDNQDILSGEWLGTTVVRSIKHNVLIPSNFFAGE